MINSKHDKPCQYLIMLGIIEYAKSTIPNTNDETFDNHERGEALAWFEGFATGLHEASVIDDITYDKLIDEISKIGLDNPTQLLTE